MKVLRTLVENSGGYDHTVILGYNPGLRFLDRLVVPALSRQGVHNIVVAADAGAIADGLRDWAHALVGLGRSWLLWPLQARFRFHAKVIAQASDRELRVWIGSGNPTHCGYSRNGEVWARFDWRIGQPVPPAVQQAVGYIVSQLQATAVTMARRDAVRDLMGCPAIQAVQAATAGEGPRLLAAPGLLGQLADSVATTPERITVVAPYYDGTLRALAVIRERWPGAKVRLWVDPRLGNLDTRAVPPQVEAMAVRMRDRPDARVHAKAYVFEGPGWTHTWIGSANCSRAGLLGEGNEELLLGPLAGDFLSALESEPITEVDANAMRERATRADPSSSASEELISAERIGDRVRLVANTDLSARGVELKAGRLAIQTLTVTEDGDGWLTPPVSLTDKAALLLRVAGGSRWVVLEDPRHLLMVRAGGGPTAALESALGRDGLDASAVRAFIAYLEQLRDTGTSVAATALNTATTERDTERFAPDSTARSASERAQTLAMDAEIEQHRLDNLFRLVARGWSGPSEVEAGELEERPEGDEDTDDTSQIVPPTTEEIRSTTEKLDALIQRALGRRLDGRAAQLRAVRETIALVTFALLLHDKGWIRTLPDSLFELFDGLTRLALPAADGEDGITRDWFLHSMLFCAWRLSEQWLRHEARDPLQGGTYRVLRSYAPELEGLVLSRTELFRLRQGPFGGKRRLPNRTLEDIEAFCTDAIEFTVRLVAFESVLLARWDELQVEHRLVPSEEPSTLVVLRRGCGLDYGFVQGWENGRVELGVYPRVGMVDHPWTGARGGLREVMDLERMAVSLPAFEAVLDRLENIQ
jgi:hypothetical protein